MHLIQLAVLQALCDKEASNAAMDGWSLLDEVDLTVHVGSDFFDAVKSAKWTERRDALQALCDTLARNPRLHPNIKYTDILAQLKLVRFVLIYPKQVDEVPCYHPVFSPSLLKLTVQCTCASIKQVLAWWRNKSEKHGKDVIET